MRKIILSLFVLFFLLPLITLKAQGPVIFKPFKFLSPFVEIQSNNKVSITNQDEETVLNCFTSFAWGVEIPVNKDRTSQVFGVGIEFQKSEVVDSGLSFRNMPVYWFYKQKISRDSSFYIPDIIVKIGYNFFTVNAPPSSLSDGENDGLFYALGLSFRIDKHLDLRITYKSSQGKVKYLEYIPDGYGRNKNVEHSAAIDNYKLTLGFNILL